MLFVGEMYCFRKALHGALVLNPMYLKEATVDGARSLVPLLKHFGFPQFTDYYLGRLKTQVGRLIEAAKESYDWDKVEGAAEYNTALEKRNKKKAEKDHEQGENDEAATREREMDYRTWRDDPAERARRIWYWWKDKRPQFTDFALAVCLVALIQVSSASSVFSQLSSASERPSGTACSKKLWKPDSLCWRIWLKMVYT